MTLAQHTPFKKTGSGDIKSPKKVEVSGPTLIVFDHYCAGIEEDNLLPKICTERTAWPSEGRSSKRKKTLQIVFELTRSGVKKWKCISQERVGSCLGSRDRCSQFTATRWIERPWDRQRSKVGSRQLNQQKLGSGQARIREDKARGEDRSIPSASRCADWNILQPSRPHSPSRVMTVVLKFISHSGFRFPYTPLNPPTLNSAPNYGQNGTFLAFLIKFHQNKVGIGYEYITSRYDRIWLLSSLFGARSARLQAISPRSVLLMWFLFLLPFAVAYHTTKCITGCQCNEETIRCASLNNHNVSFFRKISTINYPNLKYLEVNGAEFLDLPDENIFGIYTHKRLRIVNLTDCRVTSIGAQSLSGMPNIRGLYLSNNPIREVDPDALSPLKNSLETIDLSNIFDAERVNNKKVLKDIFSIPLPQLQNIYLRGNNLKEDIGFLFCQSPNLLSVDLSENRLTRLDIPKNCSRRLEIVNLARNDLTSLMDLHFSPRQLDLHNNPLDCTSIRDHLDKLHAIERLNTTFCATPADYKGWSLQKVLQTEQEKSRWMRFLVSLSALALILIMIGLLIYFLRNSRNIKRKDIQYNLVQMQESANEPEFL
ncbi:unnamed protein product [Bursaphelenchus xylophilus]|uniref:(pine wood nematode) hypothetical protein n=1 Tax=Bursaphelenchus xylophilus TaxID=6326 RepID=A0A1I7SDV5_BURXY|nr:unnamed protein product [Bursaphelenchus xylophilus]CAG9084229.1 unnamed protein product [Bursaphelenchus xylophilus]